MRGATQQKKETSLAGSSWKRKIKKKARDDKISGALVGLLTLGRKDGYWGQPNH